MAGPPLEQARRNLRAMAKEVQEKEEAWDQAASFPNMVVDLWRQGWIQQQFHQRRLTLWRHVTVGFDVVIVVGAGASGSLLTLFSTLFGESGRTFATALAAIVAIVAAARPWLPFAKIETRQQIQFEGWQVQILTVRLVLDELERSEDPSWEPELDKVMKAARQQKNHLLMRDGSEPSGQDRRDLEVGFKLHFEREYRELYKLLRYGNTQDPS